jgi:hypothetical protein
MIIELDGPTPEDVAAAQRRLTNLARDWGHETVTSPGDAPTATATSSGEGKVIDPVSVAALVLSIPSAALAVLDLADRIRKRRRAQQLIEHAQDLAEHHVVLRLVADQRPVEIATLDPDQLLDLLTTDDGGD